MPGNNSIQILRGNNVKSSSASNEVLLDGQPLYDISTGYLYVGDGEANIRTIQAINAQYANSAGSATSATTASKLSRNIYFNGNGTNVSWDGRATEVVYAPTTLGSAGKVWGIASNGGAAWIAQTEIPDTIDHANTADVAYSVSGTNVTGTVANANYANTANVAGRVEHDLYFNGSYLLSSGGRVVYNTPWDGSLTEVIYVPIRVGGENQVWGMINNTHVGWMNSPGLVYEGFIDNNGYSINGKRVLAICIYGIADASIKRFGTNVVSGIRGPVVSIDATRGGDSSVVYTTTSGEQGFNTFNASSSYFNVPGGTRWVIFTYSPI